MYTCIRCSSQKDAPELNSDWLNPSARPMRRTCLPLMIFNPSAEPAISTPFAYSRLYTRLLLRPSAVVMVWSTRPSASIATSPLPWVATQSVSPTANDLYTPRFPDWGYCSTTFPHMTSIRPTFVISNITPYGVNCMYRVYRPNPCGSPEISVNRRKPCGSLSSNQGPTEPPT